VNSKKYELIVFDWDGTLIDSAANIVACMQSVIQRMQLPTRSEEQIKHIIGLGMRQAIFELFPDLSEDEIEAFISAYRQQFFSQQQSLPFPGVEQLLQSLKQAGYALAVATGKGRHGLDLALNNLNMAHYFESTRCADETQSKPHPQMLHEILEDLSLRSEHALMVGDTSYDLDMASTIEMDAVAVCNGVHDREKLNRTSALAFLPDVTHLWKWLNSSL